jgi:CRISPR/Cas system-associated exonuclease Cas4 (RecB family)
MYKECQAKYYFEYIYKALKNTIPPEVFGPGSILHKLADEYVSLKIYKNDLNPVKEEQKIKEMIEYEKLDYTLFKERITKEYKNLKSFLNVFLFNDKVSTVTPEAKMSVLYRDDYNFFGYIDLKVLWKDGTLEIVDYKTSEEKDDHSLQMGMYAYGIARNNKIPVSNIVTGVYYTRYNEYETQKWDKEKLKEVIMEVEKILRQSEKQNTYKRCPNKYCVSCQYKNVCDTTDDKNVL